MNTKVSILIPIFNVEKYLRQCLSSIQAQTFTDFEAICINDGSTDSSEKIINEFVANDSRFIHLKKENSGYGNSMNRGLEIVKGDYIAIVESDDFVETNFIETMYTQCVNYDLDVFKTNFYLYWTKESNKTAYRHKQYCGNLPSYLSEVGVVRPLDFVEPFFAKAAIWSAMYRRSFLEENDIKFLNTPGASYQDTSFNFKVMAAAKRAKFSAEALLNYRQDNINSSVNSKGKVYCICDEHHEITRYLSEKLPDIKGQLDVIRARLKYSNYRWNYDRLADEFKDEFKEQFKKEMYDEVLQGNINLEQRQIDPVHPEYSQFEFYSLQDKLELSYMITGDKFYIAQIHALGSKSKFKTILIYLKYAGFRSTLKMIFKKMRKEI